MIPPVWKYPLLTLVLALAACDRHPATYEGYWLEDAADGAPRYLLTVDMERALRTQEVAMTGAAYRLADEAQVAAELGDDGCAQLDGFACRHTWSGDGSGLYDRGGEALLLLAGDAGTFQAWRFHPDLNGRESFRVAGQFQPSGAVAGEAYVIKVSLSGDELTVAEAGASGAVGFAGTYHRLGELPRRYAGIYR